MHAYVGELAVVFDKDEFGERTSTIKLRKGSTVSEKIKQVMLMHDSGMSKKKLHQVRQVGASLPPMYKVNQHQKELNSEIDENLNIDKGPDKFVVDPEDMLRWVLRERGIYDNNIDLVLEGDGRGTGGTGSKMNTCVISFRLLNEGRLMHRDDRSYTLALIRGGESYEMLRDVVKHLREKLKLLQQHGMRILNPDAEGEEYLTLNVRLHLLSDAKWEKIYSGMQEFSQAGHNCLRCFCHSSERAKVFKRWHTEPNRFNGPLGVLGRKKRDLFPYIPQSRRWPENVHVVMRLLHWIE
jgi:hypothetical protein